MSSVPSGGVTPLALPISARIRSASGTPPRRIPTSARPSSDPSALARSRTSCAMRCTALCTPSAFMSSPSPSPSPHRAPVGPLQIHGQVHPVHPLDAPIQPGQLEDARVLELDVKRERIGGALPDHVLLVDVDHRHLRPPAGLVDPVDLLQRPDLLHHALEQGRVILVLDRLVAVVPHHLLHLVVENPHRNEDHRRVGPGSDAQDQDQRHPARRPAFRLLPTDHGHSSTLRTARKASWGISTWPTCFMRFLPSFCFSRSLRFRLMSPP